MTLARLGCVALLVGVSGCTTVDLSEPWWIELVPGAPFVLDAAFHDDANTVSLVFLTEAGEPHLGRVKADATPRRIEDLGAITFDQTLQPGQWVPDRVDLSVRPGTGELWLYLGGDVVKFSGDSPAGVVQRDAASTAVGYSPGSLGFLDKDTLVFGTSAGVYVYPVTASGLGDRRILFEDPITGGTPRQLAVVEGQVWAVPGKGGTTYFKADGTPLPASEQQYSGALLAGSRGGALWLNVSNQRGLCVVPRHPSGGATRPDSATGKLDADCDNLDIPLTVEDFAFRRAALDPDARRLTLTAGGALFLATESRPAAATDDLEGTWCAVKGTSFTVSGNSLSLLAPTTALDQLFEKVELGGGGPIRTVSLKGPNAVIKDNVVRSDYDYFFKRSGNTLVIHGPVNNDQWKHQRNGGYLNRSGLYRKGADATCSTLAP